MGMSNYLENKFLDHLRGSTYTAPSGIYAKLHTGDPGEDCVSNAANNTTRKSVAFAAASGGSMASNALTEWTNVSHTEVYRWVSFWDAETNGNPLGYGQLTAEISIVAGETFQLQSGNVTFTLT